MATTKSEIISEIIDGTERVKKLLSGEPVVSRVTQKGDNILLYGVPGSGKSYKIITEYCSDQDYLERVVFHPDFTNSDLIGQIIPRINESSQKLEYVFSPGPFTRIMEKAYQDTEHMYYLIIEEINRGNASAIFGEIFQLLDRDPVGVSIYGVTNYEISKILYKGNGQEKIKIPSNLTILATMNTSDQNVFSLDTAFKRRWRMKMIFNDFDSVPFADDPLFGTDITWRRFAETVNRNIGQNSDMLSNDDKRLGAFFVNKEDISSIESFSEKVLMYLWNDVFKFNREEIFIDQYSNLEMLMKDFKVKKFDVFKLNFNY